MRVWARGLLGLEAAVELLIGHGTWLTRADFAAAALTSGRDGLTGAAMVSVDFAAALAARRAGGLPCSAGEEQILALRRASRPGCRSRWATWCAGWMRTTRSGSRSRCCTLPGSAGAACW